MQKRTWGGETLHDFMSDKYYRYAFENSLSAILITKPNGTIVSANQAACTMFGRSEEELQQIGRNGIVDLEDPRLFLALKEREEKGEVSVELNFLRNNGEKFPVHVLSKIFKDEIGEAWTVIIFEDLSNEKKNNSIIEKLHEDTIYLANHDYLTDTLNRRGFIEHLTIEFARNKRENRICGLAIIDVDYFKDVNDCFGHVVGDQILIHIVERLKECLRPYDTIGRYGGDEFILCLPNLDLHSAEIIGERLRNHIQNSPYIYDKSIHLSISIGMKLVNGSELEHSDINQLITDVDRLLYQAKQKRNTVCIAL